MQRQQKPPVDVIVITGAFTIVVVAVVRFQQVREAAAAAPLHYSGKYSRTESKINMSALVYMQWK